MFDILAFARPHCRAAARLALACGVAATLAACDGPRHSAPPLVVTVTSTDDAGPRTRGQDAVVTFTVTNTSDASIPNLTLSPSSESLASGATPPIALTGITCVAQGATCPAITGAQIGTATLPAGGSMTLTVTGSVAMDYDGPVVQHLLVFSTSRAGSVTAAANVTLADARDGGYVLFGTSGRVASLSVHFNPGAMTFRVSSDNAPAAFQGDAGGYVFADGSHFVTGADRLHGTYDFGAGAENFIAVRDFVTDLAALDGSAFTLFGATRPGTAPAATSVQPAWIAGATLVVCTDSTPRTATTCPTSAQSLYTLTTDGPAITGVDSTHGDTFRFFVANTGTSRVLLRGDGAGSTGRFAIGLPPGTARTGSPQYLGTTLGAWSDVRVSQTTYEVATFQGQSGFGSFGAVAALQDVAGGPAGLRQGVRGDGAPLLVASTSELAVQIGAPGEVDIFGFSVP